MRMIARAQSRARIALKIGRSIATPVPKVRVRITIAAAIPISSLISVEGLETFWPSAPPVSTSNPALLAGEARSMICWASSVESPRAHRQGHRQISGGAVLAQSAGALGRQRAGHGGDVRVFGDVRPRRFDCAGKLGIGQLAIRGVQDYRARSVRLVGKGLCEQVRRLLTVGSRQGQIVIGRFTQPMGEEDQSDGEHEPHAEDHDTTPYAESRHPVEDSGHRPLRYAPCRSWCPAMRRSSAELGFAGAGTTARSIPARRSPAPAERRPSRSPS